MSGCIKQLQAPSEHCLLCVCVCVCVCVTTCASSGLSGSSLHVWYKALSQELLLQWATHAAGVVALHKGRQGPLQQEAVDSALEQLRQCGKAFSSLLLLNKAHLKRIQVGQFCLCR